MGKHVTPWAAAKQLGGDNTVSYLYWLVRTGKLPTYGSRPALIDLDEAQALVALKGSPRRHQTRTIFLGQIPDINIEQNVRRYLLDLRPQERYASFDYCYNYFLSFKEAGNVAGIADAAHLQQSCMQLGFYLASWGMYRGSAFLLQKSAKFLEPLIHTIATADPILWEIDVDTYTPSNIGLLISCGSQIEAALSDGGSASPTLKTKIMLGVFANIPAFDRNFVKGLRIVWNGRAALERVKQFYDAHKAEIDRHDIRTFDFDSGQKTHRSYTKAKIVDMIGFIEGGPSESG